MYRYTRLILLACLVLPTVAEARVWTLRTGQQIAAEFVSADEFNVTLEYEGARWIHSRLEFSDEDKAYLDTLAPRGKKPDPPADPPGTLPIHSASYDPKKKLPRQDLANYYGLALPNGDLVTAEWMQALQPRERMQLMHSSDWIEKVRLAQLHSLVQGHARVQEQLKEYEGKGRTLRPYVGLTLEDGARVTDKILAELPTETRLGLLMSSVELNEERRGQFLRAEMKRLESDRKQEANMLVRVEKENAARAVRLAAEKLRADELYAKRAAFHAESEQALARREAEQAEKAAEKSAVDAENRRHAVISEARDALAQVEREEASAKAAARKADQEKARLELVASQKREREAITAATEAAEAELEQLRQKRAELAAADRARRQWDESWANMFNSAPSLRDFFRAGKLLKGLVLVVVLLSGALYWVFGKGRQVTA